MRKVTLVDDPKALERQQVVNLANVLRAAPQQRRQSTGGDDFDFLAEFVDQSLEDTVDQPDIPVIQPGLQTIYGIRRDYTRGLPYVHPRQTCGALEQRVSRDADPRSNDTAQIFALGRYHIESRRGAEVHHNARPAELLESRNAVDNAVGADFRRVVVMHRHSRLHARLDEQ